MRFSLQQIESFYWTARLGGFHAAARHQHLTQPTISARIQELESHLGVQLFERNRGRSRLTIVGQDALTQAERILKLADQFGRIAERRDPMRGLLRLGANESTALAGLTDLLTQLKAAYAGLRIEITVDVGVALSRRMIVRELDVAILNDASNARHVIETAIGLSNLHWVASPALVRKREVTPQTLASLPVITVSQPSSNHTLVMNWFRNAGVEAEHVSSCNSLSTMRQLVAAGHGIAVMSPAIMKSEIDAGVIHTLISKPRLRQQKYLVAHQAELHGGGVDTIIRLSRDMLARSGVLTPRYIDESDKSQRRTIL
jgi:DNA-binding transcriptional LysR family regulator